jgi:hypothetical protein
MCTKFVTISSHCAPQNWSYGLLVVGYGTNNEKCGYGVYVAEFPRFKKQFGKHWSPSRLLWSSMIVVVSCPLRAIFYGALAVRASII